jgi:hypothetical protein
LLLASASNLIFSPLILRSGVEPGRACCFGVSIRLVFSPLIVEMFRQMARCFASVSRPVF